MVGGRKNGKPQAAEVLAIIVLTPLDREGDIRCYRFSEIRSRSLISGFGQQFIHPLEKPSIRSLLARGEFMHAACGTG